MGRQVTGRTTITTNGTYCCEHSPLYVELKFRSGEKLQLCRECVAKRAIVLSVLLKIGAVEMRSDVAEALLAF